MASGPTLPPQAYTREILTAAFNWLQSQPDSVRKLATTPDALVGLYMRAQRYGDSSFEADAPVSSQNFMSDLKNLAEGLKQFEDPNEKRAAEMAAREAAAANFVKTNLVSQSAPANRTVRRSIMAEAPPPSASTPPPSSSGSDSLSMSRAMAQALTAALGKPSAGRVPAKEPLDTDDERDQQALTRALNTFANENAASLNYASEAPLLQNTIPQNTAPVPRFNPAQAVAAYAAATNPPALNGGNGPLPGLNDRSLQMIHEVKDMLNLTSDAEVVNLLVGIAYKNLKNLLV